MAKTVVGLIDNRSEAETAVQELQAAGLGKKDIGVISPEELARETDATVAGATTGMLFGGLAGMVLAAAAVAIPGVGAVLVAGPAALLLGTALGATAGGLIGGLVQRGVPEDEAHLLAEGVKRGATLVTVTARDDDQARRAVDILKRHGAVDLEERATEWKRQGWTGRLAEAVGATAETLAKPHPSDLGDEIVLAPPTPQVARSEGADDTPGIATVTIYEFEIIAMPRSTYSGPERRTRDIPHEPERRLAA
jgi:uncharacterized membrane protein